jgi:hypothetical protein
MNAAVGTTTRTSDPLGVVAALCGAAGFVTTVVLWLGQMRPDSRFPGESASALAIGVQIRDDLIVLAALLGVAAILGAFVSSLGGPAKTSAVVALVLGAVALIYPVLAWQGIVGATVVPSSLTGP